MKKQIPWILGIAILGVIVYFFVSRLGSEEPVITESGPSTEAASEEVEEQPVVVSTPQEVQPIYSFSDAERNQIRQVFPIHVRMMEQPEVNGTMFFLDCSQYVNGMYQDVWVYTVTPGPQGPIFGGHSANEIEAQPCPDGTG